MKRISSIIHTSLWLLATMLLCNACSKADEYVYVDDTKHGDGKVAVTVTDANGNTSSLAASSTLGIYVTDADGNVTFQKVSVAQDGTIVLPTAAQGKKMVSYVPFQDAWDTEELTALNLFRIQADQSSGEGYQASDLMLTSVEAGSAVQMQFTHMLAQVVIHVVDETGANDFESCGIKLRNVQDAVTVDLQELSVETVPDSYTDVVMLPFVVSDHRLSVKAIVAPQKIEAGERFIVFVNNDFASRFSIPQTADLQGGKTYTISMRLTNQGLEFVGSTVVDWDETDEVSLDI